MTGLEQFCSSKIEENVSYSVLTCSLKSNNGVSENNKYQVNNETGEILGSVLGGNYTKVCFESVLYHKDLVKSIPADSRTLRHYYQSRDIEELKELCNYSSYDRDEMTIKRSDKLFCLHNRGLITPSNLSLFLILSKELVRRNVAITTRDVLRHVLKADNKNLSRKIKKLEQEGIMKVLTPQGNKNKQRNVIFHPALVWKGDYSLRNKLERKILENNGEWWKVEL